MAYSVETCFQLKEGQNPSGIIVDRDLVGPQETSCEARMAQKRSNISV
jgi:hypothetical protein